MANWESLRAELKAVDVRADYAWADLEALVGRLPRSAYEHSAFWSGIRPNWAGFRATEVRVGESVAFVRVTERPPAPRRSQRTPKSPRPAPVGEQPQSDLVLVGCVKRKLTTPAPAKDLYISNLFAKSRAYVEQADMPWWILSAEHGLVDPDTVLAPYDLQLAKTSPAYRREWGFRVLNELVRVAGSLQGKTVEIHAGSAYVEPLRGGLQALGANVVEPLSMLSMGQRLAWYVNHSDAPTQATDPATPSTQFEVEALVDQLGSTAKSLSPEEFLLTQGAGLKTPGLYSWWIDEAGAADLTVGLAQPVSPGLIYAGLAGATRSKSGKKSKNTLWGRITTMHLGGRHEFSTFRLSLGSILARASASPEIDEVRLTSWMHEHLRVVTVPVANADTLDLVETAVLNTLRPPLNLAKMEKSELRLRLTELRREYGRKAPRRTSGD